MEILRYTSDTVTFAIRLPERLSLAETGTRSLAIKGAHGRILDKFPTTLNAGEHTAEGYWTKLSAGTARLTLTSINGMPVGSSPDQPSARSYGGCVLGSTVGGAVGGAVSGCVVGSFAGGVGCGPGAVAGGVGGAAGGLVGGLIICAF